MTEMFEAIERGELTTLFVLGENPIQSDADAHHVRHLFESLDHLVVQDIFRTATAELADVVLPASASWCEAEGTVTNSERRVQRVRAALKPPGNARDDVRILVDLAARLGHKWEYDCVRGRLERAALARAEPRRHELRAAGGARRHPVAVLQRGHARAERSCTAGCGSSRSRGRRPCSTRSRTPRRPRSSRTSSRCASPPAAGWTRSTPACRPAATRRRCAAARSSSSRSHDAEELGVDDGERVRVSSARGSVIAPVRIDPSLRPGPGVHDAALPRRGGDEPAHDQRHRPEVRAPRSSRPPRSASTGSRPGEARRRRPHAAPRRSRPADGPRHPERAADGGGARGGRRRPRPARSRAGRARWRRSERDEPRRPRRARRAGAAAPAAPDAARGPVARRLDQPRRAQLRLPAADDPAGRGVRRGVVLRAVLARAAAAGGRARLHRRGVHRARLAGAGAPSSSGASAPRASTRATARRSGTRARASGMCERAPAAMLTVAGAEPREASVAPVDRRRHRGLLAGGDAPPPPAPQRPAGRRPVAAAAAPRRRGRPREHRQLPRARRLRGAARGARDGPGPRPARGHRLEADGPRRRRVPDRAQVGGGRPQRRSARTT